MKTNPTARRVRRLRLCLLGLALVVIAAFNVQTVRFCCAHLRAVPTRSVGSQDVWRPSVNDSEVWLAGR